MVEPGRKFTEKGKRVPRPRFSPTVDQRRVVEAMTGFGTPEQDIAQSLRIAAKTLRKHFRQELDLGATKANATVAQSAFKMAISGQYPAMTMFWLKCRAGWRETAILQHTGPEGGPVKIGAIHVVISPQDAKL